MKNKIKLLLLSLITITGFNSCDLVGKIDDLKPYYQLEEDNVIWDEASANSVLRSVYSNWRERGISAFRPHMSFYSGALEKTASIEGDNGFPENRVLANNIAINSLYTSLYKVINSANSTIESLEKGMAVGMSPERTNEMIAECKFHRAMAHFYLLRHFGQFYDANSSYGIVIRTTSFHGLEVAPRDKVAKVYQQIIADLDNAIQNAPTEPTQNQHYYISKTVAKALKAKVLLYQKNYPEAANLAEEVITEAGEHGYRLEENYTDIFQNGYNSPETLFAPYAFGTDEELSVQISRTKYGTYTLAIADALTPEAGNITTQNGFDLRFSQIFLVPSTGEEEEEEEITFKVNQKYPHPLSVTTEIQGNTYLYLRLGEIYLIAAEAEARQSGAAHQQAARNYLQAITDRAGYDVNYVNKINDTDLLEKIRQHKWIELVSENYEEWFDLVRYYKEGNLAISDIKPTIKTDSQLILPIPETAISGNTLLEQNP